MNSGLNYKKIIMVATVCLLLCSCSINQATNTQQTTNDISQSDKLEPSSEETNTSLGAQENAVEEPVSTEQETTLEPIPEIKYQLNKVYRIEPIEAGTDPKVVLLTFDDGPKEEQMINGLIDVLDNHKAKAIFFVNGYRVKAKPDLLRLIYDREQIIGNHSWDHIDLKQESIGSVKQQIEDVQQIVFDTIGEKPKFFRPPFGSGNDNTHRIAEDNNLLYMTWSNGSLDWDKSTKNKPDAVIKNVLDQLHAGSNILMHELPWTVEALDTLLTELETRGYSFVDPRSISLEVAK